MCEHVHAGEEIGLFTHDPDDDGGLGMQCRGDSDNIENAKVLCLDCLADRPELSDLPSVCVGHTAERRPDGTWIVYEHNE